MTIAEILPVVSHLPRGDKLRLMQHLASELVSEDEALLAARSEYPVWSPYESDAAADALLAALDADKSASVK